MEQNDIKVGMRVRVEFSNNAFYGIELPHWEIARRRNNAVGTVASPIAETNGKGWWIQLDPPESGTRSLRRPIAEEPHAATKAIVDGRQHRAPYIAVEISPL